MPKSRSRKPSAAAQRRQVQSARRAASGRVPSREAAAPPPDVASSPPVAPTVQDLERLRFIGRRVARIDRERSQLMRERDWLVDELRAEGHTWRELADLAQTTHAALIQRAGVTS